MLKPGANYRMSGTTKRMLANFTNAHERGAWKRMMIQAELAAAIKPKVGKDRGADKAE